MATDSPMMERALETPWIREFTIDGVTTRDETHRTALIQHFVDIKGRTFLDVGAADGYESRAVARLGARRVVAVEADDESYHQARQAREFLRLSNVEVLHRDARVIDTFGFEPFDVVLCFGFLYHLQNPFNFLKRLRTVTRGRLLLETHVAPYSRRGLLPKHTRALPLRMHQVALDGVPFTGQMVRPYGGTVAHYGNAPWTFWLTQHALVSAVTRAGFSIVAYFHEIDPLCPDAVHRRGQQLGFGQANTKAWIVADSLGDSPAVGGESVRVVSGPRPYDALIERVVNRFI